MKTSKKDMVRLLCILLGVALIPLLLVIAAMNSTEKYAARPGVFYNDSFYSCGLKSNPIIHGTLMFHTLLCPAEPLKRGRKPLKREF